MKTLLRHKGYTLELLPPGFTWIDDPESLLVNERWMDAIPKELHTTLFSHDSMYEADVEWFIPVVFHLPLFDPEVQRSAMKHFMRALPLQYRKYKEQIRQNSCRNSIYEGVPVANFLK
jgi:hypothetical protein